jgi:hypothetical protein
MADKKISELTNITGANLADDDEFAVVDTSANETKAITYGELKNITGNLTFGDNDKAIFGAGSDLQIYHDGSDSYVRDAGAGNLYLQGDASVRVRSSDGTLTSALFTPSGLARLSYAGAAKLETTSTGVDVTGAVTADGLTVDTNTLHVDSTNNRVGIGTSSPAEALDVVGNALVTGNFDVTGTIGQTTTTVASLPTGAAGDRSFVTDATATTFASIVAGGGANGVPVYHDGTNWRVG